MDLVELALGEGDEADPPRQRRLLLVPVMAGALEVLQGVHPLSPHLVRLSENSLDSRVVEVLRRQLGGLQHGVELATLHHHHTVIGQ